MNRRFSRWMQVVACAAFLAVASSAAPLAAQNGLFGQGGEGFSIVGAFDNSLGADPAKVTAQFVPAAANRPAVLMVTARMQSGWHTYAMSQPRGRTGGPQPTKIILAPSPKYRLLGPFQAHPEPKSHIDTEAWVGLELREHEGEVTWFAPIEFTPGVDPAAAEIRGLVDMQVCKEQCVPIKPEFTAKAGSGVRGFPFNEVKALTAAPPSSTGPATIGRFKADGSEVLISGTLEPASVRPGETARLLISAAASPGWHVYAHADRDDGEGSKETVIAFEKTWGLNVKRPTTDAPITTDSSVPDFPTMHYHPGPVTWSIEIAVPKTAEPGVYPLAGIIGYQACEFRPDGFGSCEMPKAARFQATLNIGGASNGVNTQVTFTPAIYREAADVATLWAETLGAPPLKPIAISTAAAGGNNPADTGPTEPYDLSQIRIQEESGSLSQYVVLAFLGGLILNLMPCVLPVIGLKVMSFVEQAGKSRAHALVLNGWYSAGIISVFLILGLLAATLGLSWGGQFGSTAFNVTLAAVVFAMALSLLGVWEVPIPGFFGSGAVQDAAAKEGPLGAFLKGAVTTVLATPCTAPFMATAIAWAVSQSTTTTLIVFGALGFGMASPYLLVGVFPELLRFLPKPGQWMETFKQVTGFILMATVVFILSFIEPAAVVPTVLLLVGIGMACWLVARTPMTAEIRDRLNSWAMSGAVVLLFAVASFRWLYAEVMYPRYGGLQSVVQEGWEPFSLVQLQKAAVRDGRTVIVDFSADWCFNCKVLEKTQLHTTDVENAIETANAVKLYADFTDYPEELKDTIKALRSSGVPTIAIFPGDRPYEPIVFRDGYTKSHIVDALASAKPRDNALLGRNPNAATTAATR